MARSFPFAAVAVIAALLGVISACGGDDDADNALDPEGLTDLEIPDEVLDAEVDPAIDDVRAGAGSGSVTVGETTWTFDTQVCVVQLDNVNVEALGSADDGSEAWISLSRSFTTRESMEGIVSDEILDQVINEDGMFDSAVVQVSVGRTSLSEQPDPASPDYYVATDFEPDLVEYTLDGTTFSGDGVVEDRNGVAAAAGETLPVNFRVTCTGSVAAE